MNQVELAKKLNVTIPWLQRAVQANDVIGQSGYRGIECDYSYDVYKKLLTIRAKQIIKMEKIVTTFWEDNPLYDRES